MFQVEVDPCHWNLEDLTIDRSQPVSSTTRDQLQIEKGECNRKKYDPFRLCCGEDADILVVVGSKEEL